MTLREAISKSFTPEVWSVIRTYASPPELLKMACLTEFKFNGGGPRIEFLRSALKELDTTGIINLNSTNDQLEFYK